MRHTFWSAALAVAAAAALLLMLVPVTAGPAAAQGPSPAVPATGSVATGPITAIPPAEFAYLTGVRHVPASMLDAMSNSGMTPDEINASISAEGYACLASFACAFAAAVYGFATNWGQNDAKAISNTVVLRALTGTLQQAFNQWNETSANARTLLSTLNQTQYAMDTAADAAALTQLKNTTFSAQQDMAQSPVPFDMVSSVQPLMYEEAATLNSLSTWFCSVVCTGGVFASTTYFVSTATGAQPAFSSDLCSGGDNCAGAGNVSGGFMMGSTATTPSGYFYAAPGATIGMECSANPGTATFPSVDGGPALSVNYNTGLNNWSGPGGVFNFGGMSPSGYDCGIGGSGLLPLASGSDAFMSALAGASPWTSFVGAFNTGGGVMCVETFGSAGPCSSSTYNNGGISGSTDPYNGVGQLLPGVQNIMTNAENNARVYWTYLRNLGYTSESQVPADCTVPMPAFSLPPSMADQMANLSAAQQYSLYLAWINSIATFFDTPQNATTFCSGHPIYPGIGGSPWGNLNTVIHGFIYVPGNVWSATGGLIAGTPAFGNTSRWTFNGSSPTTDLPQGPGNGTASVPIEFTGWPEIATESIPIGKVYEIPTNDPTVIIPLQYAAFLTLTGNGTAVPIGGTLGQLAPMTSTAGDALYVTSCTIGGVIQAGTCSLSYATINGTFPSVQCGNCSLIGAPTTFGGFPNPFSWLSGLFSGLFGGGSLGSFLGSIVAGLVILAVIAVLVYVAVTEVEAWGGRKRGGGGGGGGSTIVVTGGR